VPYAPDEIVVVCQKAMDFFAVPLEMISPGKVIRMAKPKMKWPPHLRRQIYLDLGEEGVN
jgi:hypothetical protein